MNVWVQYARRNPGDYQAMGSSEWATSPAKLDAGRIAPAGLADLNQQPGWVISLGVQGVAFEEDHVAVEELASASGAICITAWSDNPAYVALGRRTAQVWTVRPLNPDARFGGALNTSQSRTIYAASAAYAEWQAIMPIENTTLDTWESFTPPAASLVRHGVWLSDAAWQAHIDARTDHGGWRG
jgi:hypothetical protein